LTGVCGTFARRITVLLLASLTTLPVAAHSAYGERISFVSGFEHPLSGLDHVIAMLAVGLWGAQLGAPAVWILPITFPLIMACGGFVGLMGIPLPMSEVAIALSAVCLGAAVLTEFRLPLPVAAVLVGVFGLFHGYAHGSELPAGQDALLYSVGFVLATGLLHSSGIIMGLLHRWVWGRFVVRVAGVCVLCGGMLYLRSAFA
jgi:urease accessory protein